MYELINNKHSRLLNTFNINEKLTLMSLPY
jgi:hypothetical protein